MDVKPTAGKIEEMALTMKRSATELERIAQRMRDTGDLTYTGEAINIAVNCFLNLRLDLMATRPIREYQKELAAVIGNKDSQ